MGPILFYLCSRLWDSIVIPCEMCNTLVNAVVMVLRVWALYNRSKFILFTLLFPYAVEALTLLGTALAYSISYNSYGTWHTVSYYAHFITARRSPKYIGVVVPFLNYSFCEPQPVSIVYAQVADFAQLALGALMCLFISIRFIAESIQTYKARKRFLLSNYMNLLVRESIFYFLVYVYF